MIPIPIDPKGRLCIPKYYRALVDLERRDEVQLHLDSSHRIVVFKASNLDDFLNAYHQSEGGNDNADLKMRSKELILRARVDDKHRIRLHQSLLDKTGIRREVYISSGRSQRYGWLILACGNDSFKRPSEWDKVGNVIIF